MHLSSLMWFEASLGCYTIGSQERFDKIINLADALQEWRYHRGLPHNWTRFGWDAGVLPPMYHVATKCQDPHVRKKAVSLLLRAAPQLGQDSWLTSFAYLDPMMGSHTPALSMSSYRSSISSEVVVLKEEKTAFDKRISMEIELSPNTQLVDLTLIPSENGSPWQVRKNVSHPTEPYLSGLC